ncbi:MAG: hypothetical protein ACLGI3_04135, partial [Actinomycetes bacterium]
VTGADQAPISQGDDMTTEMALTARRFALTLAVAGIAGLGSIAVAPAASAAPQGPLPVVYDADGHKIKPPKLCNTDKPNQNHRICYVPGGARF